MPHTTKYKASVSIILGEIFKNLCFVRDYARKKRRLRRNYLCIVLLGAPASLPAFFPKMIIPAGKDAGAPSIFKLITNCQRNGRKRLRFVRDFARKKRRLRRNINVPSSFITNNANHCHSGFFAKVDLGRRTVLDNAKKTGIQIEPAVMNIQFPSRKTQRMRPIPHPQPQELDSGLFAAWHPLRYTSFFHREKPE